LVDYKGLKVNEISDLRSKLREKSVDFNVTKNTLFKIALTKKGIAFDEKMFDQPMAVAFAFSDEVVSAKEITLFAKEHEALEIIGGLLNKQVIDKDMVMTLSKLPSKEELIAKAVGSIAAPLSGFVNVLAGNIRGLVNVLNGIKEAKS
jgi:large subunit ribosomal protein L10